MAILQRLCSRVLTVAAETVSRRWRASVEWQRFVELSRKPVLSVGSMILTDRGEPVEYQARDGSIQGWPLFWLPGVNGGRFHSPAGTWMEKHAHAEVEHIIVESGRMDVYLGDDGTDCRKLVMGDGLQVGAGMPHFVHYPEDTWSIAVCIPPSPHFPPTTTGEPHVAAESSPGE